jgi:ribonuclease R
MTTYRKKDPYREREAAEYEHPIASREFIIQFLTDAGRPLSWHALCEGLDLKTEEEQEGLRRRLKAMLRDGQLMKNRRGSYALVQKMELVPGRVQAHRDGFGFLIPDNGEPDIFLPPREMDAVFNDDRVLVRVTGIDLKGRREGQIAEIVEHNTHQVVGKYREENGAAFVDPDNKLITQDILIPENQRGSARNGQFVMVEIVAQPTKRRQPLGKVIEVLGDQLTPGMEVELAIRSHNLPFIWPDNVVNEAQKFPSEVNLSEPGVKQYTDLRNLPFVTIDGEDAKDFDDAVFCQRLGGKANSGWRLLVAIADVSHYVKPGSALDTEAKNRGNSVYFPNKVLPMLPETLSNGLCSLKPNVDRLSLVCEMKIDAQGGVVSYQFYEGIIHSQARLTYTQVANMLENPSQAPQGIFPHIKEFNELFKKLLRQRQLRGAIDFDTVETKIIFGQKGKIERIVPQHRTVAHRMIEEAMLLANVCAAQFLLQNKIATLYRVHGGPEPQRLMTLRDFLKPFNLRLSGGAKPSPKDYAKLIERIVDRPDAHLLQTVLLRSLRQAVYSPENTGHFGLAYDAYTHFTSPIRRYPDLLVHRGIKQLIHKKSPKEFLYNQKIMQEYGEHCSTSERRADLATRDATDWLKCEYMLSRQGQICKGIISDVTSFGVFVELNDIYIQGLLHITALKNDYYRYEAASYLLQGRQTGHTYRLGDPIEVLVARVDLDKRTIDFELPSQASDKPVGRPKKKRRKR